MIHYHYADKLLFMLYLTGKDERHEQQGDAQVQVQPVAVSSTRRRRDYARASRNPSVTASPARYTTSD